MFTTTMKKSDALISELNLIDLDLMEAKYTCSNFGTPCRSQRLDKILYTGEWPNKFPYVSKKTKPRLISDHCLVILDSTKFKWGPTLLRFEKMWPRHENFKSVADSEWAQLNVYGWPVNE